MYKIEKNNTIHFEELWEQSEILTSKLHKNSTINNIINQISNLLNDYNKLHTLCLSDDVVSSLKKRYMGEIVFLITSLSHKDNINVYAALQEEISTNNLGETIDNAH